MDEKIPPSILADSNPDHYLNRDRETISKLNERIEKMWFSLRKKEIYDLQTEKKELKEENFKITNHLRMESDKKTEEIIRLGIDHTDLEERYKKEREALLEEHRERYNSNLHIALREEKEREAKQFKFLIQEADEKYRSLNAFKEAKDQMERDLDFLKKEREDLNRKLMEQQTYSDQIYKRKEDELKRRYEEEIKIIRDEAIKEAKKNLSLEEVDLRNKNVKFESEMKIQQKAIESIKKDCKKHGEDNRELRQELEIYQTQIKDCANKQRDMKNTIKKLKETIIKLENEKSEQIMKFSDERDIMICQFNNQLQERLGELGNYKEQVKMRAKELKNMKALAQMILDQRSDVEQFFLESLEQIKEEVQKRIIAEGKTKKLPMINQKGKVYSDKVELSDLDWEDRERVLRLLFSKMNMGVPPQNWRTD